MSAPYPPGQPQWPGNRPRRPEPIQFRPEQPTPQSSKALAWSLRIAGLVAVAVISGLVWWYINNDESPGQSRTGGEASEQTGAYKFTVHKDVPTPRTEDNCAEHAYGQTQKFFQQNRCERLVRALYVTKVADGRTVYISVAVVQMPEEDGAAQLRDLIDTDKTGNVKDLVNDGEVTIDGLDSLARGGGYKSKQDGSDVVIVEADYAPGSKKGDEQEDEDLLDEVCNEALPLADKIVGSSGN